METVTVELNELMRRFSGEFAGTIVGKGPKHPYSPAPVLQLEIDQFLSEYPFLKQDKGYVAFLETYAGATVDDPAGTLIIISGFQPDDSGFHITRDEGDIVDESGFLCIATVQVRTAEGTKGHFAGYTDMAFSFDATGKRRPGIYRYIGRERTTWYCADFLTWLRLLVDKRGHLLDEPTDSRRRWSKNVAQEQGPA